jgi:threonine/homoserine/homoserine lactone efflux protein
MVVNLLAGVVFGLSAGFSPGPLLTFLISQTLKYGIKEGIRVALAPLLTDLPIIIITIFVLMRLAHFRVLLGSISLIGGSFVLYLTYESFRTTKLNVNTGNAKLRSLSKGAIVNALNPHPYLFWLTVGAPAMIRAWPESRWTAVAFVASFYICLVGSKILLAALVGRTRRLLMGKAYKYLMRILGVLLLIFAVLLFRDGLHLLGLP